MKKLNPIFKKQNTLRYSRLITSFIILFSTAFLINSCTQNQNNVDKEKKIVERIGTEVAFYQFHYKYGAKRMGEVITAAEELLKAIQNPENKLTEEQIEFNIHKLTWLWLAATPTTEYKALTNSGEIRLVTSETLRRKFKEMNADQEKLLQFEELQINYVNQEIRPYLNSRIDRTTLVTRQNFDALETTKLSSPFKNSAEDLLKDRKFANLLVDLLFFTRRIMLPYDRLNKIMIDMEKIVAKDYPDINFEAYEPF
jgi:heme/copper-type cytochrome/quinol oxidase subunit 2